MTSSAIASKGVTAIVLRRRRRGLLRDDGLQRDDGVYHAARRPLDIGVARELALRDAVRGSQAVAHDLHDGVLLIGALQRAELPRQLLDVGDARHDDADDRRAEM